MQAAVARLHATRGVAHGDLADKLIIIVVFQVIVLVLVSAICQRGVVGEVVLVFGAAGCSAPACSASQSHLLDAAA